MPHANRLIKLKMEESEGEQPFPELCFEDWNEWIFKGRMELKIEKKEEKRKQK